MVAETTTLMKAQMWKENETLIQVWIHGSQRRSGRLPEIENNREFQSVREVPTILNWLGKSWYFRKVVVYERW